MDVMKYNTLLVLMMLSNSAMASELPSFLDSNDINNAEFTCLDEKSQYDKDDQKYVDILWNETLQYLQSYAVALTNSENSPCLNSDQAMYDSTEGGKNMCIMDRRDMKLLVKNIYQVINNPDKAKKCFGARQYVDWIYSPGGQLAQNSPVAKWLKRTTFDTFFDTKVTNKDVRKLGKAFTKNFTKILVPTHYLTYGLQQVGTQCMPKKVNAMIKTSTTYAEVMPMPKYLVIGDYYA
jgi:hypothetical protein